MIVIMTVIMIVMMVMMMIVTLIVGIFMLGGIDLRRSLGTWLVRSGSSLKLNQCQYKIDWELGY